MKQNNPSPFPTACTRTPYEQSSRPKSEALPKSYSQLCCHHPPEKNRQTCRYTPHDRCRDYDKLLCTY